MCLLRGSLAISIVAFLVFGQGVPPRAAERGEKIREAVERLGPGADVRVYDRQGTPLRGIIESFDGAAFRLKLRETDKVFRYNEINVLELAQKDYSLEREPDPTAARRVALEIGLGKRVVVKTTAGETFNGKLLRVDAEELALETKGAGPTAVRYSDMRELKSWRIPVPAKVGIGVAVGFFATMVVIAAIFGGD